MNAKSQGCVLGNTISQGDINDGLQYDGSRTYRWQCETTRVNTVQCSATVNTVQPTYTYSWDASDVWGACSAVACGTSGTQSRSVTCKRNDGVTVVDSYCSGTKPSTSQSCSAPACPPPVPVNGACGSSNGGSFTSAPTTNLCDSGSASSVVDSSNYSWTCAGSNGGSSASCSATKQSTFAKSSCGFSLYSSNWSGTAGQPADGYNSCEWGGSMYMGSSNLVEAIFMFGDYYDGQIWRLTNPSQWTITAVGCTLNTVHDPKDFTKGMPNYCRNRSVKSYNGSTQLVWSATITAKNKVTGEVRVLPITATFKPTLRATP